MAGNTKIEWTDATWNPIAGCTVVSPGCTNCYAMRDGAAPGHQSEPEGFGELCRHRRDDQGRPVWTGKSASPARTTLTQPLRWTPPRRIFVNAMSDLFHEAVPDELIDRVFAVMALCPQHTFQVLTKRPERMRDY